MNRQLILYFSAVTIGLLSCQLSVGAGVDDQAASLQQENLLLRQQLEAAQEEILRLQAELKRLKASLDRADTPPGSDQSPQLEVERTPSSVDVVVPHPVRLERQYNEATDTTTAYSPFVAFEADGLLPPKLALRTGYSHPGQTLHEFDTVQITVTLAAVGSSVLNSNVKTINFIVDGVTMPCAMIDFSTRRKVRPGARRRAVQDRPRIKIGIDLDTLRRITTERTVEIQVGRHTYKLTQHQLSLLKAVEASINAGTQQKHPDP